MTLPRTFDPEYGTVVTRVLPAIVVMMSACGVIFLTLSTSRTGLWLALASFGIGGGFLVLYLWYLLYREIEFREERVVVRRYLFPDLEGRYRDIGSVSSMGFRLNGFPVACHTMENASELHTILDDLRAQGKIEPTQDGGLTASFRENLTATVKAALLGVLLWVLIEALDLAPASLPDAAAAYGVILATLIVGAPIIKRLSSK